MNARGSQAVVTRARSFGVIVTRQDDARTVIFHQWPLAEKDARFVGLLVPRIDVQNRRYTVELEHMDAYYHITKKELLS